ncbi:MAG: hypothetical protein FOGNACKC_00928 [Anaerolineae bacterium]|nr:hypothetical protein [Anaerolineae bacterium]
MPFRPEYPAWLIMHLSTCQISPTDLLKAIGLAPTLEDLYRIMYKPSWGICVAIAKATGSHPAAVLRLAGHLPGLNELRTRRRVNVQQDQPVVELI